jgi:hypothetical protein
MGNKTCNKCGRDSLGWDKKYHEANGKWKLEPHKDAMNDWCIKPFVKRQPIYMGKSSDYVKCELCLGNSGHCFVDDFFERHPEVAGKTLSEHKEMYHPNGEILDDIDFMVLTDEQKERVREIQNKPKPTKIP